MRPRWQERAVIGAASLVLLVAVLPPLFEITRELTRSGSSLALLAKGSLWRLLARSLGISAAVTLLALLAGVPLGVLFARAAFPLQKVLLGAHLAVVFLPPFLPALGWFHLLGREGTFGGALSARLLFSGLGVVMVMATCLTPIVTGLTAIGVRGVDASLEDAARLAGGPWRTAALVLVPCALPTITLAGVVVFTLALAELGVPMFLRVHVYPAVVFARLGGLDFAPGEAAIFALPLVFVAFAVSWVERRLAGHRAIAGLASKRPGSTPLFAANGAFFVAAALAATVSTLPLAALAVQSMRGAGWAEAARWVGHAPWNSLRAGGLAAALMTVSALVLGHALARRHRVGAWLDGVGVLAFVVPPAILGVSMVTVWNRPATSWLYGSFAILVLGFTARYSAVATRVFAASVLQIPESLEDAAWSLGAGYVRRLRLVAALAPSGLIATFVAGLVFTLRDLETVVLFYPPGGEPLSVRIFTLEANGPAGVVASLAMLHVGLTFAVVGAAWFALKRLRAM